MLSAVENTLTPANVILFIILHYFIFHFRYIGCGTVRLTDRFCRFSYLRPRFFVFYLAIKAKSFFNDLGHIYLF